MKKAAILFSLIILVSFVSGPGLFAKSYYVSNSGNDAANGLTKATAWKTIAKVNAAALVAGDSVVFQAGGTWREELNPQQGTSGTGKRITYSRYGTGNNPRILGSELSTWTAQGTTNIWQSAATFSDPDGDTGGSIYFEVGGVVHWGVVKAYTSNFSNLTQEYDWCYNGSRIYVYAPADPDTRYTSLEISQLTYCIFVTDNTKSSYMTFDGIDLHYALKSGFHSYYPEAAGQTDLTFRNCNIGYIGPKGGSFAYGVEAFHTNFLVENCFFSDCGRRAVSFNFYETTDIGILTNITIRNNIFKRGQHTTSLDLAWAKSDLMAKVRYVYFYNNIVDDSEILMTPDDASNGSNQIYIEAQGDNCQDVYIYNNVFIRATARNILISGGQRINIWNNTIVGHNMHILSHPYGNISFRNANVNGLIDIDYRNNILYIDFPAGLQNHGVLIDYPQTKFSTRDYNIYFQTSFGSNRNFQGGSGYGYYNTTQWATFKADYPTWEVHSPNPADPLFTDLANGNLTLKAGSPAIGKGTPITMVTTDFYGNPRSATAPSLGAFEYSASSVPVYTSSLIANATPSILEMTYSLSLANIIPAASSFAVTVNSVARSVSSVAISGAKVSLTLASPVAGGDVVTVAYTKPATNPLQTATTIEAASITAQPVTNLVGSAPPPVYQSSIVTNLTPSVLEITYSLSLANIVPATSAFTVIVNSVTRTVSSVAISGTKVSLTLASPVVSGDIVTVAYTKPASNPLQTPAGGQAVSITSQPVTNSVVQIIVPVYQSSVVRNATPSILEMTYSATLANIIPATSAFTVMVNSVPRAVSSVVVSGTKVSLTLTNPVVFGDIITVAYTKPASNPIQTASGGQAVSITSQPVTNSVGSVSVPVYQSSVITNATPSILEMTYSLSLASIIPNTSAFSVMVNSVARAVNSVAISGTKVSLTLASPVVYGDIVTVAYTKPATNPIQIAAGGQAVSITAQPVTNSVAQLIIPVYQSSAVTNATPSILEITYSTTLANIVPNVSAFTVMVNSVVRTVSSITISGTKVSLSLASPIVFGDVITIAYTKPVSNPIQTPAGGQAASLTTRPVTNSVGSATMPVYQNSQISNANPAILEMTYSSDLANIVPDLSAFTVNVNSVIRPVIFVSISGSIVTLTLESPVLYKDFVTVSYTKPASNPIQMTSGGQASSITNQLVTNNVESLIVSSITIYPNPASESFNIAFSGEPALEPINVRIISSSGTLVQETTIEAGVMFINIPVNLSPGFYIVQLFSGNIIIDIEKLSISRK